MAYLYEDFFELFKAIYPDVLTLSRGEELIEIKLTFNNPISSIEELSVSAEIGSYPFQLINIINLQFSKDSLKFSLYITKSGFLSIYLSLNSRSYKLVTYVIY